MCCNVGALVGWLFVWVGWLFVLKLGFVSLFWLVGVKVGCTCFGWLGLRLDALVLVGWG
jgi:hypothetical protein